MSRCGDVDVDVGGLETRVLAAVYRQQRERVTGDFRAHVRIHATPCSSVETRRLRGMAQRKKERERERERIREREIDRVRDKCSDGAGRETEREWINTMRYTPK